MRNKNVFVGGLMLETLIFSGSQFIQNIKTFFFVLGFGHPELFFVLHDISQDSSSNEDHVLPPGRVLNPDLELGESLCVSLENSLKVQLFDLSCRHPGVKDELGHAGPFPAQQVV